MWLRQITKGAVAPSPSSQPDRTQSPAPNRNPYSSLQNGPVSTPVGPPSRNAFGERSSSLTALSSTSSTPSESPRPEKGAAVPSSTTEAAHPLAVLKDILGTLPIPDPADTAKPTLDPEIDFGGLSLEEFAAQPVSRLDPDDRASAANRTDEANKLSEDQLLDLRKSIQTCDKILQSVELYLENFQKELNVVSSEIETLQTKSLDITTRMENRERVKKVLIPAVEAWIIPPSLVTTIVDGPIDEKWSLALTDLDQRATRLSSLSEDGSKVKCVGEVVPLLEKLVDKAVERIKDHLVTQIKAIRAPGANAQMIQQRGFIRFKELYAFIVRKNPELAASLRKAYVNTMRWYYHSNFSRYAKALEKINIYSIDKSTVLGNTVNLGKKTTKVTNGKFTASQYDPFAIGRRLDIIKNPSPTAITSYVAEEDKNHHYLETPFYAFNLALIDNASFEYSFLAEFYAPFLSYQEISQVFASIFNPTFEIGKSVTSRLTTSTFDSIGILLAIRITQTFAFELQRRKVPTLEDYINLTNIILWPRFQQVVDQHCESLKRAAGNITARGTAMALLSGASGSPNVAISTAPHPLTQRFGTFLYALLSLSNETSDTEPLTLSLTRLRTEFELYLTKAACGLSDKKQMNRFLFNNYQLIMTIIGSIENSLGEQAKTHFVAVMTKCDDTKTTEGGKGDKSSGIPHKVGPEKMQTAGNRRI